MKFKLKPIVKEIISILKKEGFYISRMKGDHIIINRKPPLRRPIVLVNEKRLSNVVRQNLLKQCAEADMDIEKLKRLF